MKHQANCYRTIKGERFVCYCDILSPEHEEIVAWVKTWGIPHRIYKHPDGFRRLFVLESEVGKLK